MPKALLTKLPEWLARFARPDCIAILDDSDTGDRVSRVASQAPDCNCEQWHTSAYSPGVVSDGEQLARLLYFPFQVNKHNRVIASVFSHVRTSGCSVQRDDKASASELSTHVTTFLDGKSDRKWHGVLLGDTKALRAIRIDGMPGQAVCVYDTGMKDNPAHAEVFTARALPDDGIANELRRLVGIAFRADKPVLPGNYRRGEVLELLGAEYKARTSDTVTGLNLNPRKAN